MDRREFLATATSGFAAGAVAYEFLLDDHVRDMYGNLRSSASAESRRQQEFSITQFDDVDVFLIAGQSNAVGRGTAEQSPMPPTNSAFEYVIGEFEALKDPVGPAQTGSAWPSFAASYWNQSDRPSVYVPAAVGGSSMVSEIDGGSRPRMTPRRASWGPSGGLLYHALGDLNGALSNLELDGITPHFRGVLWHQGEDDAERIDSEDITPAEFRSVFERMLQLYRTEVGDETAPFWIFQLGRPRNADTLGYRTVRRIQREIAAEDPYTTLVYDRCVTFAERQMMNDNVHYNQSALNEMGAMGAEHVASNLDL